MTRRVFVLVSCLIFLANCAAPITLTAPATSAISSLPSKTPLELVSSPRPTGPAQLSPTISSTTTVKDAMLFNCLDIADRLPSEEPLSGVIALDNGDATDLYLWNVRTGERIRLPHPEGTRLSNVAVSPDRQRIMYYGNPNSQTLTIATADGKPVLSQVIHAWTWFDNQRLISLDHVLVDPFTGQSQRLAANFPNMLDPTLIQLYSGYISSSNLTIYDPTLTRVIYPECDATCEAKLGKEGATFPVVLWDVEHQQPLARLVTTDYYGNTPLWSPDGKQAIMSADTHPVKFVSMADKKDEFSALGRDGGIQQLSHFGELFTYSEIFDDYSLSPDGRWVAFWIAAKPSQFEDARLAVMNIDSGAVTNYCVKGDPFPNNSPLNYGPLPIWSPDSTELLVISRDPTAPSVRRVVAVDIVHKYAAVIAKDLLPVGWMITTP